MTIFREEVVLMGGPLGCLELSLPPEGCLKSLFTRIYTPFEGPCVVPSRIDIVWLLLRFCFIAFARILSKSFEINANWVGCVSSLVFLIIGLKCSIECSIMLILHMSLFFHPCSGFCVLFEYGYLLQGWFDNPIPTFNECCLVR